MEVTPSDVKGQILRIPEGATMFLLVDSRQDVAAMLGAITLLKWEDQ